MYQGISSSAPLSVHRTPNCAHWPALTGGSWPIVSGGAVRRVSLWADAASPAPKFALLYSGQGRKADEGRS